MCSFKVLLLIYMPMLGVWIIHAKFSMKVLNLMWSVSTGMINGYIRFGSLEKAGQLVMISSYVQMGRHKEAFSLVHEM
ncbi:hypothetical protein AMTRI_Chr09g40670 [Amborella trichopoda]